MFLEALLAERMAAIDELFVFFDKDSFSVADLAHTTLCKAKFLPQYKEIDWFLAVWAPIN